MASPRIPRKPEDDPLMQRMLAATVADPEKAVKQTAADDKLIHALRQNIVDVRKVEAALLDGANPDRIVRDGYPALHIAVRRQNLPLMQLLLQYDANLEDVDGAGNSILDAAYQERFGAGVRVLSEAGAKLRLTGLDAYDMIPDEGENYQRRIDEVMFRALRGGTAGDVKNALALGADPNAEEYHAQPAYCALHLAIARCDLEKVTLLLDAGGNVEKTSGRGETSLDMLWWAGARELFTDDWHKIFKMLENRGARTLFSRHPDELSLNDLRRTVPIGLDGETTALHFLVRMGKMDFVMDVIRRDEDGLTLEDLNKRSSYYKDETLLDAFVGSKRLSDIFTAHVWQGRLEDMLSLQPAVNDNPKARWQVDFDAAKQDVLRYRRRALQKSAQNKPGLKLKPKTPKSPDTP